MLAWADQNDVPWHCIEPGMPQQIGLVESANNSPCDALLDKKSFHTLDEAWRKLALWHRRDNPDRPCSAVGYNGQNATYCPEGATSLSLKKGGGKSSTGDPWRESRGESPGNFDIQTSSISPPWIDEQPMTE